MISASTRFLAQPRLIIPTLIGAAATAPGVKTPLFDGNVSVAIGKRLSVLLNFHCLALENLHGNVFATEFYGAISRTHPLFKRRPRRTVIDDNSQVSLFQWPDFNSINCPWNSAGFLDPKPLEIFRMNRLGTTDFGLGGTRLRR